MRAHTVWPHPWPRPADAGAAARLIERFAAIGSAEARLARSAVGAALLAALGGNSPFLADLAVRESGTVRRVLAHGPARVAGEAMAALAATPAHADRGRIASALRRAKRVVALVTALADIGALWSLGQVTAALTALADAALGLSVDHILRAGHDRGELRLPDPEHPARDSGFVVLGMGKLGARELNYSSDVDLVLLYDPDRGLYTGEPDATLRLVTRYARALVSLMEARDADGYVFRTDLRLRPDPAATPPAVSVATALTYYESMAHNWERAAMLKARPVAGDRAAGRAFLDAIAPFVWRRGLDFAAVADIAAMKRRMDVSPGARLGGLNVKLGRGGIREIEFLAQTLQLVWGGRDPNLRDPTTLGALAALARARQLPARAAGELVAAYRFLRRVEHRLQMVADRQTHTLPDTPEGMAAFALFMGHPSAAAFEAVLTRHLDRARTRYAAVFEHAPGSPGGLDFGAADTPAATLAALREQGFADPAHIATTVRGWQGGKLRALRSERARALLGHVLPELLAALSQQAEPDVAFNRFDGFLAALPAGVQLLSMFRSNPALLERVAAVLGAAPWLAEHLARHPAALDGLLQPAAAPPPSRLLRLRLTGAPALEDAIAIIRRSVREEDFSLSVATLERRLNADEAGGLRAGLADAAMKALLPRVMADFAGRNGRVRGGAMAVVALGKAGGREMMAGSDLDLMLIYDHPPGVTETAGLRRMAASQWFVRAAHAFVAALTAPGADGALYEVDMRLRPSGRKGPVAVSLAAFTGYHADQAWTWERMALTRARVVAGPPALRALIAAAIREALGRTGGADRVRADAAAMRARISREHPAADPWDVKLRAGGQIEVEFVAQALQLIHGPQSRDPTTRLALGRLARLGALRDADAELLIHADRVWRTVQGMQRIMLGRDRHLSAAVPSRPLLRAAAECGIAAVDLDDLRASLDTLARDVRRAFVRYVGEIG